MQKTTHSVMSGFFLCLRCLRHCCTSELASFLRFSLFSKRLTVFVVPLGTIFVLERPLSGDAGYFLRHLRTSELTYQLRFFINPKILTILVVALGTVPASERSSTAVTIYSLRHFCILEMA